MKIKNPNAGALTNFEVLEFLQARGAGKDLSRVMAPVAPSEYKVYDHLVGTPASRQTREQINEFMLKCKKFNLAKAEILSIINRTPYRAEDIDPLLEATDMRFGGELMNELIELVMDVFPPPPKQEAEPEDEAEEAEPEDEAEEAEPEDEAEEDMQVNQQ
ncbi:RNA polymerase II Rpb4 core protein [Euphorbia peplus]|nr:RNA polymerase II Rpb4 core protein [Euphorbia peplus]